jgi:3-phosphoshikimate 1-carboxyvinyltransferase
MKGLLDSFSQLGARVVSAEGKCPLTIHGPVRGGRTTADGTTSQFLTALLFSLPMAEGNSEVSLEFLNEKPYIDITLSWLDTLGIKVEHSADYLHWHIPGGQRVKSFCRVIAADFSTAAFPLVAGVIAGDGVAIRNLDFNDVQGDKKVFSYLEEMGAELEHCSGLLKIVPDRPLTGKVIDLNETPDALPIMAVAACNASGETRLVNAPQARVKEADRIACMTRELAKMGAGVEELPDGMVIRGGKLHGAEVESYGDHRIAMALAVAGLTAEGETVINDAECASVTYPAFIKDFSRLGASFRTL